MAGAAMGKNTLLGARLLLVAPAAAEGGVEAAAVERVLQDLGQHQARILAGLGVERIDAGGWGLFVGMDQKLEAIFGGDAIAMFDQRTEIPARCDVQEGKGRACRKEGMARQEEH